ncbi:hypothetical protein [Streptomyces sp. NPDC017941]
MPAVHGQGVGKPGVNIGLDISARATLMAAASASATSPARTTSSVSGS